MAEVPRVGVAAVIPGTGDEPVFLMGLRKGSHGSGTWAMPGGHLEYGESFLVCAERETLEETGVNVQARKLVAVTNDMIPSGDSFKHYVTLFVLCEARDAVIGPQVMEPEKCEEWKWVAWSHVRACSANQSDMPLFSPIVNLLNNYPDLEYSLEKNLVDRNI